ncbi:MAG: JDVT-CTERM domain-containing protein [Burkholderiaceae bacterium]|nr:JDVT-CTERM domain-containing protein [Burkholderiaceae bacterium]MDZ4145032.1 JDVT-CTERM domain-containing protein [Burkholderiales bacterium]
MNLQLSIRRRSRRPSAPPGAAPSSTRTAGAAPGGLPRPVQRLWARWAALAAALVAAALVASCGGGGDGTGPASGGLGAPLSKAAVVVETAKAIDMKVLVISVAGTQPSFLAITSILDQIGVPYEKIVLTGTNATALQMVSGTLSDGAGNGKYQGIFLETGDLPISTDPFNSAMTAAQWAMLRQYQVDFGVRSATMFTRPAATVDANNVPLDLTYGLTPGSSRNTNDFTTPPDNAVTATLTISGQGVFDYLNPASPVIVKNAFTYLSTANAGTQTVPLLTATESGTTYAIASTFTGDGWENLAISADANPELTHALLTGYGVVNWVTKGVFLGSRKVYLSAQPDDVFIPDDLWDIVTHTTPGTALFRHRNTGLDYDSLAAWQTALNSNTQTASIKLEMPFNGVGYNTTDPAYLNPGETTDTLSPAVRANPDVFRWINHTWDHSSLNPSDPSDPDFVTPTVASITNQLTWNHQVATGVRSGEPLNGSPTVTFSHYNQNAMIQPDISGLENPVYWEAAQNFGLRYILMDTSRAYSNFIPARPVVAPIPPNTGFTSSLDTFVSDNPRIFIIPRYPTNLFFNVSTPAEWVDEYNFLFDKPVDQGGVGGPSTYQQILNRESEVLLGYMLKFHALSWMFHAANLRDYNGAPAGNNSLLSDLLDTVTNKYKAVYNLPIENLSQTEIGQLMQNRMAYNAALAGGLKGRIVFGSEVKIELTNPSGAAVNVPMTGVSQGMTMAYGGQTISSISLAAGGTTSFAAPAALIPPQADLSVTLTASTASALAGGTLTYSVVISNAGPATATAATFSDTLPAGLGTLTNVVSQASVGATTSSFTNNGTSLSGTVNLPAGGKVTVTYQVSVAVTTSGTVSNLVTVNAPASITDPAPGNNSSTAAVNVSAATDLGVTKTASTPTPEAGGTLTYTLVMTNAGPSTATSATFADTLPAGLGTLTAVTTTASTSATVTFSNTDTSLTGTLTIPSGGAVTVSFVASVARDVTGTIANLATVSPAAGAVDPSTGNNTSTATVTVAYADVASTVNLPASAPAGSVVSGTVTFTNLSSTAGGTATTATAVAGTVTLSNGDVRTFAVGNLAPGASSVQNFTTTVPATTTTTVLSATSTVTTTTADLVSTNNTGTATLAVLFADVTTAVTLPANAPAGSVVTVTATFTNSASGATAATATAVTGTVTLSNGVVQPFIVGDLAPGASVPRSFTTTVPSDTATAALTAGSVVASATPESNGGNNTATASLSVLFSDPGVLVNAIPSGVSGSNVTTTVVLSNNGATTVTFTPQIVINGSTSNLAPVTLAPAQSSTTAPITVPVTATGSTVTANVTAPSVPDSNSANNTSTQVGVALFADVTTAVTLPANAPAGSVVTVNVNFTNSASGATAATATAVTGTVTLSNGVVQAFAVGDLAPGASTPRSFTTTVPSAATLAASSVVATSTPESTTGNNTGASGNLTVLFSDPGVLVNPFPSGVSGSNVTTTVVLSNSGAATVTFTPQLVINGSASTLAPVTLAPGASVVSAPITVPMTATGGTLTANVTAPSVPDSNSANNTDTKVSGALFADVTTAVTLPANAPAGSVVTVTATFTNSASGATAATATAVTGTVTLSNGQAQAFAVGDLAPGASSVQTFTTTVPSALGTTVLNANSTVATATPESNTGNNTGVSGNLAVLFADPGVVVNPIPSALEGVVVQTTLTLSNQGSTTVTFTPQVVVNGGAPVLLGAVTLAPGQSAASAPISVLMTATGATVTASVTAPSVPDRNPTNDTSVVSVAVTPPAPPPPPPAPEAAAGGCTVNPDAKFDPLLWMMLLVGGVAGTFRRRRTVGTGSDRH